MITSLNMIGLLEEYNNRKEIAEVQIEYVKKEIGIRAESLKIGIDELCEKLYKDLDTRKDKINK